MPSQVPSDKRCSPTHLQRWMAVSPHVPLSIVEGKKIREAGNRCCAPWAEKNSIWTAVDSWGQKVGTATLEAGSGYAVTNCYDYEFKANHPPNQPVLYLWQSLPYQDPTRVEWRPTTAQKESLQFIHKRDMNADSAWSLAHEATKFTDHEFADTHTKWEDFACNEVGEGKPEQPRRTEPVFFQATWRGVIHYYAITSGLRLRIYKWHPSKGWLAQYQSTLSTHSLCQWAQPWAVFDMNHDGYPEVIMHQTKGFLWSDSVLQWNSKNKRWKRVAQGVLGSTA